MLPFNLILHLGIIYGFYYKWDAPLYCKLAIVHHKYTLEWKGGKALVFYVWYNIKEADSQIQIKVSGYLLGGCIKMGGWGIQGLGIR